MIYTSKKHLTSKQPTDYKQSLPLYSDKLFHLKYGT